MYLLIIISVLFAIFAIWKILAEWDDGLPICGMVVMVFFALLAVGTIAGYRANCYTLLSKRDALQNTYDELRKSGSQFEMATVGKEIAEWNAKIAVDQYWNRTQWDLWYPDAVETTKPIH